MGASELRSPRNNVRMTVGPALSIFLGPQCNNGIVGDISSVGVEELGPLRNVVGTRIVWSALGISMGPWREINRGEHCIGLYCRLIIDDVGGGGGGRWRQIA